MAQQIPSLVYQAISPKSNKGIATVILDPTIDLVWNVKLIGSVQDSPVNVEPKFISVNNIAGNVNVSTKLGAFTYQTPPFTRETTISIPDGIQDATFQFDNGALQPVTVYISEDRIADNINNQLLIQKTAAKTLVYQYTTITTSGNQLNTSGNTQINFVPVVGAINYNLLDIAGAPVDNGFLQFIQNEGSFPVSIIPFGAQTINRGSLANFPGFSAASPMVLNPGDSGILTCDGSQWFFRGGLSFVGAEISIVAATQTIQAHGLGKVPVNEVCVLVCKVADAGYSVNDELRFSAAYYPNSNGSADTGDSIVVDQTNITLRQGNNPTIMRIPNKTTGAVVNYTAANWRKKFYANVTW